MSSATLPDIREFPVSDLRRSIEAHLAQVPADVPVAVLAHADRDADGKVAAQLGVYVRLGKSWSFSGVLQQRWHKKLEGDVVIAWYPGRD